jgi:hypothetical protein
MNRLFGVAILAGVLATGLSCGGDGGTNSGPGDLQIRLTAPAANADSAIQITITGPAAPTAATAGTGLRLFVDPGATGTTRRYALTGRLTNGATILTISVPDAGAFAQYQGTIDGVASDTYQLRTVNAYALAITR